MRDPVLGELAEETTGGGADGGRGNWRRESQRRDRPRRRP